MLFDLLAKCRCVAIVRLDDLSHGLQIAQSLVNSGIRLIEFTLTNPDACKIISEARRTIPALAQGEAMVGIGSVRSLDEGKLAIDSGAQFIVSPITVAPIIDYCKQCHVPVMPGALTPTEIALAWSLGADIVKVFPARGLGPAYIRDVLAPMPYLQLMPTGGIDLKNVGDYLTAGVSGVGIGGQLLDMDAIQRLDWQAFEARVRPYAQACSPKIS